MSETELGINTLIFGISWHLIHLKIQYNASNFHLLLFLLCGFGFLIVITDMYMHVFMLI